MSTFLDIGKDLKDDDLLEWESDAHVGDGFREGYCKMDPRCSKGMVQNILPSVLMRAILLLDGFVLKHVIHM